MELTISYSPEQIILLLAKESLSLDEELKIDGHNFILRFLGLNFKGVVEKEISGDFITYTFKSKLGGAKLVLTVKENENSFSNFRADIRSWGLLGWILKNKIGQALFNLVVDIEFKENKDKYDGKGLIL